MRVKDSFPGTLTGQNTRHKNLQNSTIFKFSKQQYFFLILKHISAV